MLAEGPVLATLPKMVAAAPPRHAPAAARRLVLGCALMLVEVEVEVEAACCAQGCAAECDLAVSARRLAVSAAGLAGELESEYDGDRMEASL